MRNPFRKRWWVLHHVLWRWTRVVGVRHPFAPLNAGWGFVAAVGPMGTEAEAKAFVEAVLTDK